MTGPRETPAIKGFLPPSAHPSRRDAEICVEAIRLFALRSIVGGPIEAIGWTTDTDPEDAW